MQNDSFFSVTATGAAILGTAVSGTNPSVRPRRNDTNTGVGSNAADELSLITGGGERVRITDTEIEINGDLNHDGLNVGFYGTAPVAQAAPIGAPAVDVTSNNTAIIAIRNALRTIGLIAT